MLLYTICILIVLGSGMYMYLEGERVPNLSILICGSLAYVLMSNGFASSIKEVINSSLKTWLCLISNKKNYFDLLIVKLNNVLYIIL